MIANGTVSFGGDENVLRLDDCDRCETYACAKATVLFILNG